MGTSLEWTVRVRYIREKRDSVKLNQKKMNVGFHGFDSGVRFGQTPTRPMSRRVFVEKSGVRGPVFGSGRVCLRRSVSKPPGLSRESVCPVLRFPCRTGSGGREGQTRTSGRHVRTEKEEGVLGPRHSLRGVRGSSGRGVLPQNPGKYFPLPVSVLGEDFLRVDPSRYVLDLHASTKGISFQLFRLERAEEGPPFYEGLVTSAEGNCVLLLVTRRRWSPDLFTVSPQWHSPTSGNLTPDEEFMSLGLDSGSFPPRPCPDDVV